MSTRIYSIDSLRAIAIFFVVIAHVTPFLGFDTYGTFVYFVLDTIGQFDVPFFFVASGYFFAKKVDHSNVMTYSKYSARKLSSLYLFGILFALAASAGVALIHDQNILNTLLTQLFEDNSLIKMLYYGDSIAIHLWFLTGLLFSICFISLFVAFEKGRYVLPVATIAHVLGILSLNYPMIVDLPYQTQDALFFGFFYVALGYHIRSADWTVDENHSQLYLGAVCVFLVIQLLEQYAIYYHIHGLTFGRDIYWTEFTVSTVPLVFVLFAYALSKPDLGKGTILPDLGEYAVGVYLVHLPVYNVILALKDVVTPIIGVDLTTTVLWHLLITPFVYTLSLAVYILMAKMGIIEIGGSHIPWLSYIRTRLQTVRTDTEVTAD